MKIVEKNVMRLVAVQHLRTAFGIKTKNWNKNKAAICKPAASSSTKVFGVSLESLPYYNMECGSVPSFLVDACMILLAHVDTEGLFRKSGSVVRLKALRAKLDAGEECLSTALPCDVAGLVKQFFRELPEPVFPSELQEAFLKAQQLPAEGDRTSATMLLSCVLPDRNLSALRHFFDFLHIVSNRSAENKMDSSNLSVILAPNILHTGDGAEKMNANTEKRLKLQAATVLCFIENAHSFGVLPQFLQEKVPAMMGCETGVLSPAQDGLEELDMNSGMKRRQRRSFGDMVSGALNKIKTNRTPTNGSQSDSVVFSSATPVIATPTSKRKLPLESAHSFGFSNKKRRSVKKSLGIDLLPNTLFSAASTPGSAYSASGVLDSSQNTLSSAGKSRRQSAISSKRKSRRLSNRHAVNRVESGRAGCFSPKVGKKEAPRKSLRLRFSLGKSSKEAASESIGWRLATQESTSSFCFAKESQFSPSAVPPKAEPKSSKFISKSEDNLLTPQRVPSVHHTSWIRGTPVGAQAFSGGSFSDTPMSMCLRSSYVSEPAIVVSKPPSAAAASLPMKLCCASSAQSLESQAQEVPTEPSSVLQPVLLDSCSATDTSAAQPADSSPVSPPEETSRPRVPLQSPLAPELSITFGQIAALSPLHIDSIIFESGVLCAPAVQAAEGSVCAAPISGSVVGHSDAEEEQGNCSRLIDALDIQSPAHFKRGVSAGLQSTPCKLSLELTEELGTPPNGSAAVTEDESVSEDAAKVQNQQALSRRSLDTETRRVADHIYHFNKLTLHSPKGPKAKLIRSPLKFQRTPVRQTVRRMNSLLSESKRPSRSREVGGGQAGPVVKAVSLESGLSPHPQLHSVCPRRNPPPVPPEKPSTLARKAEACALADVTNKMQPKAKADCRDPSGAQKLSEKDTSHYRGSPRNPLNQVRLLSATKPVDF